MKPPLAFCLTGLVTALIVPVAGLADHGPDAPEITDVLVTAPKRTMIGGTVLDDSDFQARRAASSDAARLLSGLPGVFNAGASGLSTLPVIRGLADDRLRIRVDGMDLVSACGNHMNPPLSYVDPSSISAIELMPGVSPVSMGGDSIGGTIVVDSTPPEFAEGGEAVRLDGSLATFYRSNGNGQGVSVGLNAAGRQLGIRYSGAFARAGNYDAAGDFKPAGLAAPDRHWLDGDEVGATGYESQNHKLGLGLRHGSHLFELDLGYQHIPYQGFPNQRMDMLDNTSYQVTLAHGGSYDWGALDSRLYWERTDHAMNFGPDKQFRYGDAAGMPMATEGDNRGVAITASYDLSQDSQLRVGSEVQHYGLDDWWPPSGSGMMMAPDTFWNIRNGERDRYALFGEWQNRRGDRWLTVAGLRYEAVRSDAGDVQGYSMMYAAEAAAFNSRPHRKRDDNWDFSLQLQFTPDATRRYEVGVARKSRSPNLYERYTWSSMGMAMRMVNLVGDGNGYVGNLELEPEIAHTVTLSAAWHDPQRQHWHLAVTPYLTLVDDYIDAAPCRTMMCQASNATPGFRYLTFANDDARLVGIDVEASRHLLSSSRLGDIRLDAVASYVDGKNETTGDNLYNIMPLTATLTLVQAGDRWHNSLEWQLVSAKDQISAVRNEIETAGYGLLSLRSGYKLDKISINIGVENLLDKSHDLPLGGAYVGQGATMPATAVPWGIAVPGPGRSFYLGVAYRL